MVYAGALFLYTSTATLGSAAGPGVCKRVMATRGWGHIQGSLFPWKAALSKAAAGLEAPVAQGEEPGFGR